MVRVSARSDDDSRYHVVDRTLPIASTEDDEEEISVERKVPNGTQAEMSCLSSKAVGFESRCEREVADRTTPHLQCGGASRQWKRSERLKHGALRDATLCCRRRDHRKARGALLEPSTRGLQVVVVCYLDAHEVPQCVGLQAELRPHGEADAQGAGAAYARPFNLPGAVVQLSMRRPGLTQLLEQRLEQEAFADPSLGGERAQLVVEREGIGDTRPRELEGAGVELDAEEAQRGVQVLLQRLVRHLRAAGVRPPLERRGALLRTAAACAQTAAALLLEPAAALASHPDAGGLALSHAQPPRDGARDGHPRAGVLHDGHSRQLIADRQAAVRDPWPRVAHLDLHRVCRRSRPSELPAQPDAVLPEG
eukprot:CAMPEP_0113259032 /NCGR_PEP_ID=MMETSP0008_2-20120614/16143_1 /TAXON_ID=97485 /ORGANISM="Prymnesium parvum" /LENGTH=364 /DNA_ID=CAMNT_0000107539 /DNA_START=178 /DNA_END=1270 /DNA_ORIENTATION=- /assembly_acc=CAM_ASM_000153